MLTKRIWISAAIAAAAAGVLVGRYASGGRAPASMEIAQGECGCSVEGGKSGKAAQPTTPTAARQAHAVAADVEARPSTMRSDLPGDSIESFDDALKRVLSGVGGHRGLRLSRMRESEGDYSFTVPALNASQVKKALSGNTLRNENHFAIHFTPSGQYRGWSLTWAITSRDRCPSKEGPRHGVVADECSVARANRLEGTWSLQGDLMCLNPPPIGVSGGERCVRLALALDGIILFAPDGSVIGKGSDLLPGLDIGRKRTM